MLKRRGIDYGVLLVYKRTFDKPPKIRYILKATRGGGGR